MNALYYNLKIQKGKKGVSWYQIWWKHEFHDIKCDLWVQPPQEVMEKKEVKEEDESHKEKNIPR